MTPDLHITSPDDPLLDELCSRLLALGGDLDRSGAWPAEQLRLCGEYGVYQWFIGNRWGGQDWSDVDLVRGYLRLSAACLTTTFILTQRSGACRRIEASDNEALKERLLPDLASGATFATVGISHLTTSRRHLAKPALAAVPTPQGFVLDGYTPWVTGALHAQTIVVGAALDSGSQILVALPTKLPGVRVPPPAQLLGLQSSHTGEVLLEGVQISSDWPLVGPAENVMASGSGGNTGGLQTSTLAIGLAGAAIEFLATEAQQRADLLAPAESLRAEWLELQADLLAAAAGEATCSSETLRSRANSLVLRATQAALAAAKGSGYVVGHPAGRWCREALFFLVWSCPQPVMQANLCELAGLQIG